MQKKQMAKHDKAPAMNCRKVKDFPSNWPHLPFAQMVPSCSVALGTFRLKFQTKPLHVVLPRATGSCQHNPPMARLPATALAAASCIIVLGCGQRNTIQESRNWPKQNYFIILPKILQNTHRKNDISGRLEDIHYICCFPVPNLVPVCIVGLNKHRSCQKNSSTYLAKPMQKKQMAKHDKAPAMNCRKVPTPSALWTNGSILFVALGTFRLKFQSKPLHVVLPRATGSCQHNPPMARLPATALAAASGIIVLGCWAAEYHPRVPKLTQTKSFHHFGKDSSKHPPKERHFRTFGGYSLYMLLSSSKSSACVHCWFKQASDLPKKFKHIFGQADAKKQMAKHDESPAMNCRKVKDLPSNRPHLPLDKWFHLVPLLWEASGIYNETTKLSTGRIFGVGPGKVSFHLVP